MDDEYEIVNKEDIDDLRHEIKQLRENPFGDKSQGKTLLESMDRLTLSINKLLSLFEKTHEDLVEAYEENNPVETMNEILDQNEKIAKGTLAVADIVKKQQEDISEIKNSLIKSDKESLFNNSNSELRDPFKDANNDNSIPDMSNPMNINNNQKPILQSNNQFNQQNNRSNFSNSGNPPPLPDLPSLDSYHEPPKKQHKGLSGLLKK